MLNSVASLLHLVYSEGCYSETTGCADAWWLFLNLRQQTPEAWRTVFFISAAVYAFGTIFYAVFGSGELQPWATPSVAPELHSLREIKSNEEEKGREARAT